MDESDKKETSKKELKAIAIIVGILLAAGSITWCIENKYSREGKIESDCKLFLPYLNESGLWTYVELNSDACSIIESRHEQLGIYREYQDSDWFTLDQSSNWTWTEPKNRGGGGKSE
jgi:hypothetical protein